jgi:hypothetical protein
MTSSTVANNVHTPQAPTAALSWEAIMSGQFTTSPARRIFEETVISRAASAKAALPGESSRIDRGRDLVLANRVQPQPDGSFVVHSTSERGKSYTVANSACTCPDAEKAPSGRCKHVLSTWIWRKSRSAVTGQALPPAPGASNGQHAAQDALQATNGRPDDSQALPQDLTFEEEVEVSVALAANRPAPQPPLPEAPASMNVYIELCGRKVQVTLRDSDETRLLVRLEALLQRFPTEEEDEQEPPEGWCSTHSIQMQQHHNAKGTWWSHKTTDGWCRGK